MCVQEDGDCKKKGGEREKRDEIELDEQSVLSEEAQIEFDVWLAIAMMLA